MVDTIVKDNVVGRLQVVVKRLESRLEFEEQALAGLPESEQVGDGAYHMREPVIRTIGAYKMALNSLVGQFPDFKKELDPEDKYGF